jgi:glutamine amidotransferase
VSGPLIAILDYGMGNLRSVEKALGHVGATAEITADHGALAMADGLILPGVGAFPKAMGAIRELDLDDALGERVAAGTPVLGICLGMQLLFERSAELGGADGLGLLPGEVEPLKAPGLKLPQIGWNGVTWRRGSRLTAGLPDPTAFYHVHSFAARPARQEDALGIATYGGEFASAVEREPVYGVQFHPEKSGPHGLRLLSNFAAICRDRTAAATPA